MIARLAAALVVLTAAPAVAQFPPEVAGRVIDRVTRAAVPGAVVENGGVETRADAAGGFRLRGLVPGTSALVVRAFGYRPRRLVIEVRNGAVERVMVELDPLPAVLDPVTVEGVRDAASGVTVIDRVAIERSRARDLGELLQSEVGVTVTRLGGPGAPARISIRGSSASDVLVLLDGTPLNSPLSGEADLSAVPLESVRRIRVVRGAQSARYGGRALAGVVAVETMVPGEPELMVGVGAGSYGERSAAFRLSSRAGRAGGVGGAVTGEWRSVDGDFRYPVPEVRGGGEAVRRNADAWQLALGGTGAVVAGATTLRARADGFAAGRGMPGSIVQPSGSAEQDHRRVSGGVAVATRRRALGVRADVDAQRQEAEFRDAAPPLGPAYDESVEVTAFRASAEVDAELGVAAVSAGAELRRLWFRSTSLAPDAPGAQNLAAVWMGGRWQRRAGSWVIEVHPAVRVDWNTLLDDPVVSPRAGVSLGTGRLTARASVGAAFSPPSLADQFFQEGVLARPNPELAPERVRAEVEASVEWQDIGLGPLSLAGDVTVFRADVDGMILWFPDHLFVWQPNNFAVRRRGAEARVALRLPGAPVEAHASVTHVSAAYAGPSLSGPVIYRPTTTASVSGAATLLTVAVTATARYVGSRRTVAGSALNALAPYWIADVRLARDFRVGRWGGEGFLSIENLLDHQAFMLVDYPTPGRSWRLGVRIRPWLAPHVQRQTG